MSISCQPNDLLELSRCYECIPSGMQPEVMIYLLNQLLPVPLTPDQLMEAAKCMRCIPHGMQPEVQIYLLCQILNP
jgi:hypothetical protein